ncbi:hypothetical protein Q7P36_000173 [Cladosporium allicinum]
MNSLHRIALTTLTILLTSLFAYLFYKTTSHIGRPLGRILTNLLIKVFPQDFDGDGNKPPNASSEDSKHDVEKTTTTTTTTKQNALAIAERTSSIIGAALGLFVFVVLFPLAFLDSESVVPVEWLSGGEGERLVAALVWVGWMAVRCWGETVVVLAVLAGVVKVLRLDAGVVEKDDDVKRSS